ncbi:MAG TPA: hypothetical protein GXZ55_09455 [Natronincola sp.]|nr:hypothetical protein [Natronincola sp.]
MKCPKCKKVIAGDSLFCNYCGVKFVAKGKSKLSSSERMSRLLLGFTTRMALGEAAMKQLDPIFKDAIPPKNPNAKTYK